MKSSVDKPFIVIEGPIGVGKTTLAKRIGERMGYMVMCEPVRTNPYLDLYYSDGDKSKKRWGAMMQLHLLFARYIMHQMAICTPGGVVQDRSIYGDTCFLRALYYDMGLIDDLEKETYDLGWEAMNRYLVVPDGMIFLDCPEDIYLDRISQRDRQAERDGLDSEYLSLIAKWTRYLQYEMAPRTNVVSYDWSDPNAHFEDTISFCKEIEQIRLRSRGWDRARGRVPELGGAPEEIQKMLAMMKARLEKSA